MTTTTRMIAGPATPDRGSAVVDGRHSDLPVPPTEARNAPPRDA
jgi:hypothetical protein